MEPGAEYCLRLETGLRIRNLEKISDPIFEKIKNPDRNLDKRNGSESQEKKNRSRSDHWKKRIRIQPLKTDKYMDTASKYIPYLDPTKRKVILFKNHRTLVKRNVQKQFNFRGIFNLDPDLDHEWIFKARVDFIFIFNLDLKTGSVSDQNTRILPYQNRLLG